MDIFNKNNLLFASSIALGLISSLSPVDVCNKFDKQNPSNCIEPESVDIAAITLATLLTFVTCRFIGKLVGLAMSPQLKKEQITSYPNLTLLSVASTSLVAMNVKMLAGFTKERHTEHGIEMGTVICAYLSGLFTGITAVEKLEEQKRDPDLSFVFS